ncbi:hypothetical protein FGM00_14585 [Aggregatimonas sangjinii]|uniref:Uncharacterized protein n=1 Tax=Aggregatimonas sangjinii TaxID=2583587 RepID=A0A5B7SRU4_9FLAO|nr:hypothetical protein [Aggregatimonas sangjinii]QCX01277.1 hypothetical protein FGM00_14585 [Aggregatimonas sangjinii]
MKGNLQNSEALLAKAEEQKLYGKLVAQLKKDFGLANIHIDFPIDVPRSELPKILHEKLYVLLMEKFSDYLNLIYVIDIPEKAFKEIQVTDSVEVAGQVSFLILKRELQKVTLRQKYDV